MTDFEVVCLATAVGTFQSKVFFVLLLAAISRSLFLCISHYGKIFAD